MSPSNAAPAAPFPNVVLVASAGTGKTHRLTQLLLRALLVERIAPARVVATTFSRKAAAELQERLESVLVAIADGDLGAHADALAEVSPLELQRRAQAVLPQLGAAHVTTMHALFYELLRGAREELGLDVPLELVEEDELRADDYELVHGWIEAELSVPPDAQRIDMQALLNMAGGLDRLVEQLLEFLARAEEADVPIDELRDAGDAAAIAARVDEILRFCQLDESRAHDKLSPLAAQVAAAHAAKDPGALAAALRSLRSLPARGKALEPFKRLKDEWDADWGAQYLVAGAARALGESVRAALAQLVRLRRERLRETGRIGFGDVLRLARELLQKDVHYARYAASRFDVLLVDEFQDTSPLQRELLALLWERTDSARRDGEPASLHHLRPRGLAIVGDRKQAIYGFRGADVAVFGEVTVAMAGEAAARALCLPSAASAGQAEFVALQHNYRSRPELMQFVNALSARALRPQQEPQAPYEIAYAPQTEDLLPPAGAPRSAPLSSEPVRWLREVLPAPAQQADAIARDVLTQRARERAAGRELPFSEIAVLARTNEQVDVCAAVLSSWGIPVVVGGTRFYRTQELADVRVLLEFLCTPGHDLAAAAVLRGPAFALRDQSLLELSAGGRLADVRRWQPERIQDATDRERVASLREPVLTLRELAPKLRPEALLSLALESMQLQPIWASLPSGAQRLANVRKLQRIARRFHTGEQLARFLRLAAEDDRKREGQAATFRDDEDAVRVMTVHASKGLAFDLVYIPRIDWSAPRAPSGSFYALPGGRLSVRPRDEHDEALDLPSWQEVKAWTVRRDAAEQRRLLYVACTRARRGLVFVGGIALKKDGTLSQRGVIAEWLSELEVPQCEVPLDVHPEPPRATAPAQVAARQRPLAKPRALRVTPTALQDFVLCPRRHHFAHVIALPEAPPAFAQARGAATAPRARSEASSAAGLELSAREQGAVLHRLLETVDARAFGAEEPAVYLERLGFEHPQLIERVLPNLAGGYAQQIAAEGAQLEREAPFQLRVPDADGAALLEGTMDLVVRWPNGELDVVDYKRDTRKGSERYRVQLAIYQMARQHSEPAARVRAGLWAIGAPEVEWFEPMAMQQAAEDVRAALRAVRAGAHQPVLARRPVDFCRRIHCGYRPRCHSDA